MNKTIRTIQGFTLIELAIVMFILGLILASLLAPLSMSIEQEKRNISQSQLRDVKDAMLGYAISNGRLPCPDCRDGQGGCADASVIINDGIEDVLPAAPLAPLTCAAADNAPVDTDKILAQGNVPWVTLGVNRLDAWNNQMSYYVDNDAADFIANGTDGEGGATENLASITLGADSFLEIYDRSNTCVGAGPQVQVAQNVTAIVISHGANTVSQGNGIIQAPLLCNELENFDVYNFPPPYFEGANHFQFVGGDDAYAITNNGNPLGFDDMVIWITSGQLKGKLMSAGLLP